MGNIISIFKMVISIFKTPSKKICSARGSTPSSTRRPPTMTSPAVKLSAHIDKNNAERTRGTTFQTYRSTLTNSTEGDDPIITLDVGGTTFRAYRSNLTRVEGSYFAARFGGNMDPGGVLGHDQYGQDVYYIDGNPELFRYILDYLRTGTVKRLPNSISKLDMIQEAQHFGLDGFIDKIAPIIYSCSPSGKDVLFFLGTNRGTEAYQNPCARGLAAVTVQEAFGDLLYLQQPCPLGDLQACEYWSPFVGTTPQTQVLPLNVFQGGVSGEHWEDENSTSETTTPCGLSEGAPWFIAIQLKNIAVQPSHYSLRYAGCGGMYLPWSFDGSEDGKEWTTLHTHDGGIPPPPKEDQALIDAKGPFRNPEQRAEEVKHYLESKHRYTWEITTNPNAFLSYFRIVVHSPKEENDDQCWHGTGLEIYGNVRDMS